MRSAFALRINSGRIILNFGFQESLRTFLKPIFTGGVGTNSLSQSLTALTAPSGREPLARPDALRFSLKLYRHAKGPISEGGCRRRRLGEFPHRKRLSARRQTAFFRRK